MITDKPDLNHYIGLSEFLFLFSGADFGINTFALEVVMVCHVLGARLEVTVCRTDVVLSSTLRIVLSRF